MAITYTWSVKEVYKITATGAVYKVDWQCQGVDADTGLMGTRTDSYLHTAPVTRDKVTVEADTVTPLDSDGNIIAKETHETVVASYRIESNTSTVSITENKPSTPDHTAGGFTAYADLTEADVLAWVWDSSEDFKTDQEANLASQIEDQKNPKIETLPNPWQ